MLLLGLYRQRIPRDGVRRDIRGGIRCGHEIYPALLLLRRYDPHCAQELLPCSLLFRSLRHHTGAGRLSHHARGVQEVSPGVPNR